MTQIHWKTAVDADFNTAADWSTGTVPGATDDAILDAKGAAFTVTASTNETVNSIQLAKNATLAITGGSFTATNGTGAGVNAGLIAVGDRTSLVLGGSINNSGSITLAGSRYGDTLEIGASGGTLTGGGQIALNDFSGNIITGSGATATLTNVNNTISGSGQLGNGSMTLINESKGVIDASATNNALVLNTSGEVVTNGGLIEATGAGGLNINSTTVNGSSGGIILAGAGSHVNLATADIVGGTLTTTGSGVIQTVDGGSVLDGTKFSVTNAGTLDLLDRTGLTIQGSITNTATGVINLIGSRYGDTLTIGAAGATLAGGAVILNDFGGNIIEGTVSGPGGSQTVSTLTNKTTISGAGVIGNTQLSLVNAGLIDATGANALTLDTGGGNAAGSNVIINSGTIESTNPGALSGVGGLILSSVTITNTTGIIEANGAATHVDLRSATITGGTLKTLNGGVIETVDGGSVLDGTKNAVTIAGSLNIIDRTGLTVQGTINNTGSINLNSTRYGDTLTIGAAGAILTGAGQVVLDDASNNLISGSSATATLTNVNNTISGSGQLGNGSMTLINDSAGVIDASGTNNALVLNTSGEVVTNSGLIEATGAGGLDINSTTVNGSSGGVILAAAGSHVSLASADIVGGTLTTKGSGVIQTVDTGSVLDGTSSTVNNAGSFVVLDRTGVTLEGAINNTGSISLDSTRYGDTLTISSAGAVLTGGGQILLDDASNNLISGSSATATLTNVNNTISGGGQLGNGSLILINESKGVIDASATNNALVLNTSGEVVTNNGLIEATGAAGLDINSTTVNGSGGGVILAAAGSHVSLATADIVGGTLTTSGSGYFQTVDSGSVLDGTTSIVNNAATIDILDRTGLTLQGTINNTGAISLNGSRYGDTLTIAGNNVTLAGHGAVVLNGFSGNRIVGSSATTTLTNLGNVLEGSGQLFDGDITFNNAAGVVDANGTAALVLSTPGYTITNGGTLEGTGSGGLIISGATVAGSGGTIKAASGSSATLTSSTVTGGFMSTAATGLITIGNGSSATLDGVSGDAGTILVDSTGSVTSLAFDKNTSLSGGGVLMLSANKNNVVTGTKSSIVLTNVNDTIEGSGKLGDRKLALDNEAGGVIDGDGKLVLTIDAGANTITNAGLIEASNKGKATISSVVANTGTLEANGGSLTLQAAVTGSGAVDVVSGTLDIANANAGEAVAFTGKSGTLELDQSQTYTGQVSGFSTTGKTSLDLRDIGFVSPSEATFSGTAKGGVLTVTDGTHTAHIKLAGNYLNSTFVASSDGKGGVTVVDSPAAQISTHAMVAAMAGMGASGAAAVGLLSAADPRPQLLAPPSFNHSQF